MRVTTYKCLDVEESADGSAFEHLLNSKIIGVPAPAVVHRQCEMFFVRALDHLIGLGGRQAKGFFSYNMFVSAQHLHGDGRVGVGGSRHDYHINSGVIRHLLQVGTGVHTWEGLPRYRQTLFFKVAAACKLYALSLHDALPI